MTIDDTTVAASRGEVRIDTDGTLWTRATAAWKQYPQTQYSRILANLGYAGSSSQAPIRGQVYLCPFQLSQRMTINKIYYAPQSTSGTVRIAIYADAGDTPVGGAKLADSGNLLNRNPTAATFNLVLNPGLYWAAYTFSTSANLFTKGDNTRYIPFMAGTFSYAAEYYQSGSLSYSKSTVLPSICPAITFGQQPVISFFTVT